MNWSSVIKFKGGAEHKISGQARPKPQAREEHLVDQTIFDPGVGDAGGRRLAEPAIADDPVNVNAPSRA